MSKVVLLGTLDTKSAELDFVRSRLLAEGVSVTLVDCGVFGATSVSADIGRAAVARAAGHDVEQLAADNNRGAAVIAMAEGAERILAELFEAGQQGPHAEPAAQHQKGQRIIAVAALAPTGAVRFFFSLIAHV